MHERSEADRPAVLLIDDGELDRIHEALVRTCPGVSVMRASGDEACDGLPMPCDLLVSSSRRTLSMPELRASSPGPAPTWVCLHTQDFHPLRERLRRLGVHFLLQASASDRTLELFLGQLLHRGSERRREPRLPIGCEVRWRWKGRDDSKGTLLDLSHRGIRIATHEHGELPIGAIVGVELPAQLTGETIDIVARVERCETARTRDGERLEVLLVWDGGDHLDGLEPHERAIIEELVESRRIGPRVAALAPRPTSTVRASPTGRRSATRENDAATRGTPTASTSTHSPPRARSEPWDATSRSTASASRRPPARRSATASC